MNESRPTSPQTTRMEALIEAMDRPLLVLALVAMGLYLLDIGGVSDGWPQTVLTLLTFVIDSVFAFDLVLKLVTLRKEYRATPWFLIDLLSSLPLLDTLANGVLPLRAVRFFRGFRVLRIFRGLRVLRGLRAVPGFVRFTREARADESVKSSHRAMNLGMLALTAAMMTAIVVVRHSLEREYVARIDAAVASGLTSSHLSELGGGVARPHSASVMKRTATLDGRPRTVYFDLRPIDHRVDQFEFFLTLGMMFSMIMFMYIMAYYHMGVTEAQLRGLLNLALPRQVADQLVHNPTAYNRKTREPATVMFMDFVGFTRTCEAMAHDPDKLSGHLEAAMDRLVGELARHDMIIDKFIGDAVMSFRGGPLVSGTPAEHARRAVSAALDSTTALAALGDPYFHRVKIGGASAADCLIGAFGTSARLSYTILGDGVNLAARLEPACAQCGTSNLFDDQTYRLCTGGGNGNGDIAWRRWGRIRVAGKSEPIMVYEAFDPGRLPDTAFLASFHLAIDFFEGKDFERALAFFSLSDSQRPGGDEPSRAYARRCDSLIRDGIPDGWEPVFDTHK